MVCPAEVNVTVWSVIIPVVSDSPNGVLLSLSTNPASIPRNLAFLNSSLSVAVTHSVTLPGVMAVMLSYSPGFNVSVTVDP